MVLPVIGLPEHGRGLLHGVGAVRDHDAGVRRGAAALEDQAAVVVRHLQAVDHHQGLDIDLEQRAAEPSISGTCVSLKKSSPVSSLYSLSKVPPVTKI